jgi:hypothetical protein
VQGLAEAADAGDVEAFTAAVADFDSLTRLDAWKTTLLVGDVPAVHAPLLPPLPPLVLALAAAGGL